MLRVLQIANPRSSSGMVYNLGASMQSCISARCAAVYPCTSLPVIRPITGIRAYGTAGYGTTGYAAGGDSSSAAISSSRTYYVRREGDPEWVKVTVSSLSYIADLTETIARKLRLQDPLNTITLHRADVDDVGTVKALEATALPSLKSLEKLNLADGSCIVVKDQESRAKGMLPKGLVYDPSANWNNRMSAFLAGRIRETFDIVCIYMERARMDKPRIAMLPHMRGLGKSALALRFPSVLNRAKPAMQTRAERRAELAEILHATVFSDGICHAPSLSQQAEICDPANTEPVIIATLEKMYGAEIHLQLQKFKNCQPFLVIANISENPFSCIKHAILEALFPYRYKAYLKLDLDTILGTLLGDPQRQLVIVIDEYYNWDTTQYDMIKLNLQQWAGSPDNGVCVIFAGVSSTSVIKQLKDTTTLNLVPVHLSPLKKEHVREIVVEACKLKGCSAPGNTTLDRFSEQLVQATGGHARACIDVVREAVIMNRFAIDPHTNAIMRNISIKWHIQDHFASLVSPDVDRERFETLQNAVVPAVTFAAITDCPIDLKTKIAPSLSMSYGDVMIGFPLPMTKVTTHQVKFSVGSMLLPELIDLTTYIGIQSCLSAGSNEPLISALVSGVLQYYGKPQCGVPYEKLFALSILWNNFCAQVEEIRTRRHVTIMEVMPFLTLLERITPTGSTVQIIGNDKRWPILHHPSHIPSVELADSSVYTTAVGALRDTAQLFIGKSQGSAPDIALLTNSFHLLLQLKCLDASRTSWGVIAEEISKLPSGALAMYAKPVQPLNAASLEAGSATEQGCTPISPVTGIFMLVSTHVADGIVTLFEKHSADLICVESGNYPINAHGSELCTEYCSVQPRSPRLNINANGIQSRQLGREELYNIITLFPVPEMKQAAAHKAAEDQARLDKWIADHSSDKKKKQKAPKRAGILPQVLQVPPGVLLVIPNPYSRKTMWQQMFSTDIISLLHNHSKAQSNDSE